MRTSRPSIVRISGRSSAMDQAFLPSLQTLCLDAATVIATGVIGIWSSRIARLRHRAGRNRAVCLAWRACSGSSPGHGHAVGRGARWDASAKPAYGRMGAVASRPVLLNPSDIQRRQILWKHCQERYGSQAERYRARSRRVRSDRLEAPTSAMRPASACCRVRKKYAVYSSTSLWAMAKSASSRRVETPVLSKTFERCRLTVSSEMENCVATSRLEQPSTMQVTTSSSRGVRP
jgi:hypothetical protein